MTKLSLSVILSFGAFLFLASLQVSLCWQQGFHAIKQNTFKRLSRGIIAPGIAISVAFTNPASLINFNVAPNVAVAADTASTSVFAGQYNDPNHPGCLRKITVKAGIVNIVGSDNIDGSNQWLIQAKEDAPGVMFVDFSPKGGPKDLLGTKFKLCERMIAMQHR